MHIHVVKRGDTLSSIAAMHDALPGTDGNTPML